MTVPPKLRVLVVDDEPLVAAALQRQLRRRDFEVEVAASGREALERLFASANDDVATFDIVLSDYRMPHMNGLELLTEVARRAPATVRVMVSGYFEGETAEPMATAPFELFVRKPWNADALADALRAAIATRRAAR